MKPFRVIRFSLVKFVFWFFWQELKMVRIKKKVSSANIEINMTPMIDCTFQLIIFFILTAQMASQDLAKLVVPKPSESMALSTETKQGMEVNKPNQVTVNIVNEYGDQKENRDPGRSSQPVCYKIGSQTIEIGDTAALLDIFQLRKSNAEKAGYKAGDFYLEIRADRDIEFAGVEPVMLTAAEAGISKMNITAIVDEKMKVNR